jgi:hypothetical protein
LFIITQKPDTEHFLLFFMPAQSLLFRSPAEGIPARELESTAAFRLGMDKGGWVEKSQEGHWVRKSSISLLTLLRYGLRVGRSFWARWWSF